MGANNLEVRDAMKGVNHVGTLWERIDWQGFRPGLQPTPIGNQLRLPQLGVRCIGWFWTRLAAGQAICEQLPQLHPFAQVSVRPGGAPIFASGIEMMF